MKKISKNNWEGIKIRQRNDYNYQAIWHNLSTIRLDRGEIKELPPSYSEFYDVSIGNCCKTGRCEFCYVSANPNGRYYEDICETWKKWMNKYYSVIENGIEITDKPFQIAIGSEGEPCEHPLLPDFLRTVYETGVVPNYTTNGVVLSFYDEKESKYYNLARNIIDSTKKYVGGVAVSYSNKSLRKYADKAINILLNHGECHVMIHHIISDKNSVDEFLETWKKYGDKIKNHVILPLMPNGRSNNSMTEEAFHYLEDIVNINNIKNIAFGAHMIKLLYSSNKIKTWLFPAETYSKNVILQKDEVKITPSSYNLNPIETIKLV